jgi:hypothetical protein
MGKKENKIPISSTVFWHGDGQGNIFFELSGIYL